MVAVVPSIFSKADGELLGVGRGAILQHADRDGLSQLNGGGGVAAPVDAGVDSMAERNVDRELVQFASDRDLSRIGAGIGDKRKAAARRHDRIWDNEISVKEELEDRNASAPDRTVSGWISRMGR